MKYQELAKRLRELGCEERRQAKGSHRIWYNPATNQVASAPGLGRKRPGARHCTQHHLPVRDQP
ncbi:MAG: type II toxin-antitoxin system HicA family toxin [Caldilinea sp.]|nr:type II toxin-antitoxin system HicA family toxin [Caldilinea sp.]